jgi:hypothetical protein
MPPRRHARDDFEHTSSAAWLEREQANQRQSNRGGGRSLAVGEGDVIGAGDNDPVASAGDVQRSGVAVKIRTKKGVGGGALQRFDASESSDFDEAGREADDAEEQGGMATDGESSVDPGEEIETSNFATPRALALRGGRNGSRSGRRSDLALAKLPQAPQRLPWYLRHRREIFYGVATVVVCALLYALWKWTQTTASSEDDIEEEDETKMKTKTKTDADAKKKRVKKRTNERNVSGRTESDKIQRLNGHDVAGDKKKKKPIVREKLATQKLAAQRRDAPTKAPYLKRSIVGTPTKRTKTGTNEGAFGVTTRAARGGPLQSDDLRCVDNDQTATDGGGGGGGGARVSRSDESAAVDSATSQCGRVPARTASSPFIEEAYQEGVDTSHSSGSNKETKLDFSSSEAADRGDSIRDGAKPEDGEEKFETAESLKRTSNSLAATNRVSATTKPERSKHKPKRAHLSRFTEKDSRFTEKDSRFTGKDSRFTERDSRFTGRDSRLTNGGSHRNATRHNTPKLAVADTFPSTSTSTFSHQEELQPHSNPNPNPKSKAPSLMARAVQTFFS